MRNSEWVVESWRLQYSKYIIEWAQHTDIPLTSYFLELRCTFKKKNNSVYGNIYWTYSVNTSPCATKLDRAVVVLTSNHFKFKGI